LYVQLAPYFCYSPGVNGSACDVSAVRLAQADCMPHIGLDTTGMAVTIDLGDPHSPFGSVHSRLKEEVARWLALQAMHVNYAFQFREPVVNVAHPGEGAHPPLNLSFSGPKPTVAMATIIAVPGDGKDTTISVSFVYAEGLCLKDTRNCTECCAGAGDVLQARVAGVWVNGSDLSVKGGRLTGRVAGMPTAVRYAYANYPQCALYNSDGLPAGPFVMDLDTALAAGAGEPKDGSGAEVTALQADMFGWLNAPPMGLNTWNSLRT